MKYFGVPEIIDNFIFYWNASSSPSPDLDFMDEAGPLRAWYTTMKTHENTQKK